MDFKIIDCRARPDTEEFLATLDNPQLQNDMRKLGTKPPTKAYPLKECMDYFQSLGVSRIVCMGRDMAGTGSCPSGATQIDNNYIAKIATEEPDRILVLLVSIPLARMRPKKSGIA